MNQFFQPSPEEARLIEEINKYNNYEFSLIRMTPTMLDKSTIDASAQIRDVLVGDNFIDYELVEQGGEKIYVNSLVLSKDIYERKTSFYRPQTKKGDPRFWIYGFKDFVQPGVLIYFTVANKTLVAIPLTNIQDFGSLLSQVFRDPEAERALEKLKEKLILVKTAGWIKSVSPFSNAPKDAGETLEKFMGIAINNLKTPDFLGKIELKSKRDKAGTMDTLFGRVPDWDISKYKTVYDIVDKFGYVSEGGHAKRLYNDIKSIPNAQGLYLVPDDLKSILYQNYSKNGACDDVCAWRYNTVKDQLHAKHPSTLWVGAEERITIEGEYEFKFNKFELTSRPLFAEFITLIKTDKIIYDWKAKIKDTGKGVRNHGPGFRVKPSHKGQLFKELIDLS
ncbi:MvaI/BcnI family restriction endonuclease [Mucilaginibacter calamicampi]|uniref:MvaI/BcnI family restriction endonuclease n=1 Tax=Mucilaginibacter calamicampi TaxID=1302352 RepID=A0ABW2YYG7_9SPHI